MVSSSSRVFSWVALALLLFIVLAATANGHDLSARYYEKTCPNVQSVVKSVMAHKVANEPRMGPAILRLFFHDCFVNVRPPCLSCILLFLQLYLTCYSYMLIDLIEMHDSNDRDVTPQFSWMPHPSQKVRRTQCQTLHSPASR